MTSCSLWIRLTTVVWAVLYWIILVRMHHHVMDEDITGEWVGSTERTVPSFIPPNASKVVHVAERQPLNLGMLVSSSLSGKFHGHASPTKDYVIDPKDRWEAPSIDLPDWMKDYFRWHKQQRQALLNHNLDHPQRYLVATCLRTYRKCGGFADRLFSLPFLIKVAAASHRMLLFKWGRPAELEEFLVPPVRGLDWRVDSSLWGTLEARNVKVSTQDKLLDLALQSNVPTLFVKFQANDHGQDFFDQTVNDEYSFRRVFRGCWHVFFTPAPPIATQIEEYLRQNGLIPGNYKASHLRAFYTLKKRSTSHLERLTRNAMDCTLATSHDKVFFASDSAHAVQYAKEYGTSQGWYVLTPPHDQDPLHLDKTPSWEKRSCADFYDTFVDFYLLALAQCVTYGMGGFGLMATFLSESNRTCHTRHQTASRLINCSIYDHSEVHSQMSHMNFPEPLFPPPISDADTVDSVIANDLSKPEPMLFPNLIQNDTSKPLWEQSTRLPTWMKNYFAWHREQRRILTLENWEDFRYVVMVCMKRDRTCGGTADRLRPFPVVVRVASESKRLLFIKWERPTQLENFLMPPIGGFDWRAPDWLVGKVRASNDRVTTIDKLVDAVKNRENILVRAKLQVSDHGSEYYITRGKETEEPENALQIIYRDCWFTAFTPVPAIAHTIESEMKRMQLVPGEFSYAHVRAQYGVEVEGRDPVLIKNWTINSLNCISRLRPGSPVFFSADSKYAQEIALSYGKSMNTSIVSRLSTKDPIHLDIVNDWDRTDPTDYNSVFVDLYIMSFGVCMTYNIGGFGLWGQLLSGRNFNCTVRHWTKGVPKRFADKSGCKWRTNGRKPDTTSPAAQKPFQTPLFLPPMASSFNL